MAITFNSPQDRFGLQAAGTILAQAMLNKTLSQLQNEQESRRLQGQQEFQLFRDLLGQKFEREKIERSQNAVSNFLSSLGINVPVGSQNLNQNSVAPSQSGLSEIESQTTTIAEPGMVEQQTSVIDKIPFDSLAAGAASPDPQVRNLTKALIDLKGIRTKQMQEGEKFKYEKFKDERNFHSKLADKVEEKMSGLRESLPRKRSALSNARNAIETGNLGAFGLDNLADITGFNIFRTAKGAQLITASKENLLSNMSRVSAKGQNKWFEQRLNSMFPQIGQSKEANLTIQEMLEAEEKLDEAVLKKYEELSSKDRERFGFVKNDIDKRVYDELQPLEDNILKRSSYRMKVIEEQERGPSELRKQLLKKVPEGTPLTPNMYKLYVEKYKDPLKAIEQAKKLGYVIYPPSKIQEYERK